MRHPPFSTICGIAGSDLRILPSEMENRQPANLPEVPEIRRSYAVTKFERGHAYQQVSKRDFYAAGLILSVDLAGAKGHGRGDRVNRHRSQQLFDEFLAL